jgi:hypothetical protein
MTSGPTTPPLDTLHRFPVDAFKIDRSFIESLATGDRGDELIRAIIAMGRALGLAVVAEGIETTEQLGLLQEIGCASGQGFLFMPPVSGDQALNLIGRVLCAEHPAALITTATSIAAAPLSLSTPVGQTDQTTAAVRAPNRRTETVESLSTETSYLGRRAEAVAPTPDGCPATVPIR